MELKKLSAPEKGYMHVCRHCHSVFYTTVRCDAKWCPDCRRTVIKNINRERYRKIAAKKKANEAAAREAVRLDRPAYCERMRCTNPGAMCGTREFCSGCRYAGGGRCYDAKKTGAWGYEN